ncbi:hypothetical protein [Paraburkholderia adhaesiva]|uniref:hypothetical protein n=1 Tax=Paraburkholderia adhaesiva TaxID=2883244 RepID=UPI001F2FF826|nr:hypothetical protein [Paraburkholderia adhaesiva]
MGCVLNSMDEAGVSNVVYAGMRTVRLIPADCRPKNIIRNANHSQSHYGKIPLLGFGAGHNSRTSRLDYYLAGERMQPDWTARLPSMRFTADATARSA